MTPAEQELRTANTLFISSRTNAIGIVTPRKDAINNTKIAAIWTEVTLSIIFSIDRGNSLRLNDHFKTLEIRDKLSCNPYAGTNDGLF
jgi:hypothetical protein